MTERTNERPLNERPPSERPPSDRVFWLLAFLASFVMASSVMTWWHVTNDWARRDTAQLAREANRTPPLDYGPSEASFLSPRRLSPGEITARVVQSEVPTLVPGRAVWACFARVTWLRNDCDVRLHWWFEELPQSNPSGPRLRLDFDRSEHTLNHQDYLGPLPPKCREFELPEQLSPGRTYALVSKDTSTCPGTARYGAIYVTPPEMLFRTPPLGP